MANNPTVKNDVSAAKKAKKKVGFKSKSPFELNDPMAPAGSHVNQPQESTSDVLNTLQSNRTKTLRNVKSPLTRRDISGNVVDEAAPQGLDRLRDIPHSWDPSEQRPNPYSYGTFAERMQNEKPTPFHKVEGQNVTGAYSDHGMGYSPKPGGNFHPTPAAEYNDGLGGLGDRLTLEGRGTNAANILAALGDASMNPAVSPFERRLAEAKSGHINFGEPGGSDPTALPSSMEIPNRGIDPSALPPPPSRQSLAPLENGMKPMQPAAELATSGTKASLFSPESSRQVQGLIPQATRGIMDYGSRFVDFLLENLIDPSLSTTTQDYVASFLPQSSVQPPPVVGPMFNVPPLPTAPIPKPGAVLAPGGGLVADRPRPSISPF